MKHNHPFTIGERVWDDHLCEWATVSMLGGSDDEDNNFLVLVNDKGKLWEASYEEVYQIAEGIRTANTGDIVCYEHNETEDEYPYYCPALTENLFSVEVVSTYYDSGFKDGSAYELVQKLQDAVLSIDGPKITTPVFVEDENGRLESITHIWYDPTRQMIRLTVGDVEFSDAKEA